MYKFEKIPVWQAAMGLAEKIYRYQRNGPEIEKYGLLAQLRRSVCSVPLNIAEGQGSNNDREFVRYLQIARGSLYEVVTALQLLSRLYQTDTAAELKACHCVGKQLSNLIHFLRHNTASQRLKIKD